MPVRCALQATRAKRARFPIHRAQRHKPAVRLSRRAKISGVALLHLGAHPRPLRLLALAVAVGLLAQAQNASFVVNVEGKPSLTVTAADLASMPRHTVTANQHGKQISYEGVYMRDVLAKAGVPFGSELKGKRLSTYVLAVAHDGYAVVYTLPEMDPDFSEGDLLIADKVGGQPEGPFRIIAPHNKKPARSLRMLERIEVVQLVK